MISTVKVWHLEMTAPPPPPGGARPYQLRRASVILPELNRFLYMAVGGPCRWYMRKDWNWHQWRSWLARDEIETWIAYFDGTPIGYFELEAQAAGTAEILYFGLITEFIGQGYGKLLLEDAIDRAWQPGRRRVWLHTCSLDHPRALDNYVARGFRVFKEEQIREEIPDSALQPWQGADKPLPDSLEWS